MPHFGTCGKRGKWDGVGAGPYGEERTWWMETHMGRKISTPDIRNGTHNVPMKMAPVGGGAPPPQNVPCGTWKLDPYGVPSTPQFGTCGIRGKWDVVGAVPYKIFNFQF